MNKLYYTKPRYEAIYLRSSNKEMQYLTLITEYIVVVLFKLHKIRHFPDEVPFYIHNSI